jgi:hypothetical protein
LPELESAFFAPYASQGLSVIALNPYDPDALNVGGLEEYLTYLDVAYPVGVETNATYDAFALMYQGSNPYPIDIIVGRDQTIRYIGRELDIPAMEAIIQEALAE